MILSTALVSMTLGVAAIDDSCQASRVAQADATTDKNIIETALAAGSFKTLAAALTAGELVDALQGDGPFTVFAPTDAAFAKLPEKQLAALLLPENKGLLQSVLTYHVVPGRLAAKDVIKLPGSATLNGQRLDYNITDAGVWVESASVVTADIHCSNGIIHVIDTVMLPSTKNIVETALEAGTFQTLAAALTTAELVDALQSEGPFTVFAPTDEAFAALPEGTVESLLKPENRDKLVSILKFHVVPGRVYSEAVAAGHALTTLQGHPLQPSTRGDAVMVGAARVIGADIETTNGVVHVIDRVLLPE